MFFWLSHFSHYWSFLNVFRYISFRALAACVTSFLVVFVVTPFFINWIRTKGTQPIREDGPPRHLVTKQKVPTMGGVLIILSFLTTVILWTDMRNPYVWIATFLLVGLGFLGSLDDITKISQQNSRGISAKKKLIGQIAFSAISVFLLVSIQPPSVANILFFPFFKNLVIDMSWVYSILAIFVIVGTSNAVNLTDGLDGLAIGPTMISCAVLGVMAYIAGHGVFSQYLHTPFVPGAGELLILCASVIGSGLGFLWYNAPPASIMMGDIGALSLGGFLGVVSLMIKQEILLVIVGGVFVAEALSVIIQVAVFKRTGRRIFLMAPIHHHFEKKGWEESTVVFRFWIVSILLGLIALSALKIR
jgi:phospho-N-acetylmuramoyl-pentapeptide-transferase